MSQTPGEDPLAAVRPYVDMAAGVLGISAAKAAELAQGLWAQGGDVVDTGVRTAVQTGDQVSALLSPDQVRGLVREEVDRVVRRLGFAREDELASLRREVGRLEQQVSDLAGQIASMGKKSGGKKSSGKKSSGKKSSGKKSGGGKS
jgi:polyhydroxyalkanoate synthesis regulator phasin